MDIATLVGAAASACSVSSFAPQAWKVIRSRDTRSISAAMYALTVTGFALWLAYGVMLGAWPLILTNGICLLLAAFILAMKLLPQRGKDAVAETLDPG
jgi:MtN3 and saliva related transmembrane protein